MTAISNAKKAASSRPWYKSVEIAREITTAPADDTPCINRKTIIAYTLGKITIAIVLIRYITKLIINGFLRPYLSLIGPISNCPSARPTILPVKVS